VLALRARSDWTNERKLPGITIALDIGYCRRQSAAARRRPVHSPTHSACSELPLAAAAAAAAGAVLHARVAACLKDKRCRSGQSVVASHCLVSVACLLARSSL